MPLTPLVIPKRNDVEVAFTEIFEELPTVGFPFGLNNNYSMPYLPLYGGSDGDDTNGTYSFAVVLPDDSLVGLFNPADDPTLNDVPFSISPDMTTAILSLTDGVAAIENTVLALGAGLALGPAKIPVTNTFTYPLGTWANLDGFFTAAFRYGFLANEAGFLAERDVSETIHSVTVDGTWFNAWQPDTVLFPLFSSNQNATMNDGVWNYSLYISGGAPSGDLNTYAVKWQPQAYNVAGPFNDTQFELSLSDAADDLIFQDATHNDTLGVQMVANTDVFILNIAPLLASTLPTEIFIVAGDLSWYDKIIFTLPAYTSGGWFVFFIDIEGNVYLFGQTSLSVTAYQVGSIVSISGLTEPPISGMRISDIYKLPCWHPCVPHAKKGPAFV